MSPPTLLDVVDLGVTLASARGSVPILQGITFGVSAKEVVAVVGRSGSGKSVLARALTGWVERPLSVRTGSVHFKRQNVLQSSPATLRQIRGRGIGYVGADPGNFFDPTIPVGHQIVEKLRTCRPDIGRREAFDRVLELFTLVRIPEPRYRMGELPSKYSGGMIQRAAIVDAIVGDAELIIADNVTQPLDVTVAAQIIRLFSDLRQRLDTSFVFVASSLAIVKEFADRLLVLDHGQIVERSDPYRLIESPGTPYSRELVDQSPKIWAINEKPTPGIAMDSSRPAVLSVNKIARSYRARRKGTLFGKLAIQAVRGVSLDVFPGESIAIVGESGCGKSTLMRLLTWLEAPDAGEIRVLGRDVARMSSRQRFDLRSRLQLVLQDPYGSIPAHWTIGRIISEPLRLHRRSDAKTRRAEVQKVMGEVGLDAALFDKLPVGLSAGQRQRINVARALVLEPSILLLDETLSALDPTEQGPLLELFERLQRNHSITCIFISHDLAMVRRVASRVAVMYLGRIVEVGSNEQVFRSPRHPYTRALLSAAPTIEQSPFATAEYLVDGEPPSPIHLPPGCAFANRCPIRQPICLEQDVALQSSPETGGVACHFPMTDTVRSAPSYA
ncbi:peptide/nickel transport system ATP-binding protein [Bradyrhizobium sp. USDA 4369]